MNFTVVDTVGVLKACFALIPFLFAPGYAIGWALDLFQFREQRTALKVGLAVPLSIAICPIVSYLLGRFLQPGLWVFYVSVTAGCLLLLARDARRAKPPLFSKYTFIAFVLLLLWIVIAIGSLVDLQLGQKLYSPVAAYDHSTRVEVMAAIGRRIPPNNPFFAHPSVPLRYHYLWMLLCSLPLKVWHLSPRHLMIASIVWCGLGLAGMIVVGLKFLLRTETAIARKALIGCALLAVTGLDFIPILYLGFVQRLWLADMEWWNESQITSWAASLLWVPHNVAALIACLVGFILLRHEADRGGGQSLVAVMVAGIAFASAAGLSVYVTFTFVVAILFWLLALVAQKNWREVSMFVGAGAVAVICALPYLASLRGPGSGAAFVEFALRPFSFGVYSPRTVGLGTPSALALANAVLLPLNYTLELGFFLMVGVLRFCRIRRERVLVSTNELACWTLVLASFVVGTFLRSSTISSNDLGFRCFLPAQLIFLLWAATLANDWRLEQKVLHPATRAILGACLALGLLGTAYEVFMIRMAPVLFDRREVAVQGAGLEADGRAGERTYAQRAAYEALDAQLPASAIIQNNPKTQNTIPHGLYSLHDAVAGGLDCGTAFGGDPGLCTERVNRLILLFDYGIGFESTCRDYGIDIVVAKDLDNAWHDPSSWIWSHTPIVSNDYVRAFRCGATAASARR